MSDKNEISIYKKDLGLAVTKNVSMGDLINSNITKSDLEVIIAAKCFTPMKFRKEIFDGDEDGNFKGLEARQYEIRQHISAVIFDSGFGRSWSKEELSMLIEKVLTDVLRDFSFLTTQEVGLAFRRGCREEYGEFKGLSTRQFYTWIKKYLGTTKLKANKSLIALDVPKEITVTPKEKKERRNKWLESIFLFYDRFVIDGIYDFYDTDNMFYNILKELELIPFTKAQKNKCYLQARENVINKHDPLKAKDSSVRLDYLKVIDKIKNKDKSVEYKIIAETKHIILKKFINQLKDQKKSLRKLLTDKI